jgi:uncharacterized protein (DUF2267 family)
VNADEFVAAVRDSAGIDTREHAEKALRATLAVLGQRLAGEAADLAAQLPPQLVADMSTGPESERFGLDEFYRPVAAAEGHGCSEQEAPACPRGHRRAARGRWCGVLAGARPAAGRLRRPNT